MSSLPLPAPSFKDSVDYATGYFFVTDTASRVLYTNQAIEERTGFSSAEVIGKKPGQLWGGRMPRSFYTQMWHTIQEKRTLFVSEVSNEKKNKQVYQEHIFIFPIVDQQDIRYFIGFQPQLSSIRETAYLSTQIDELIHSPFPSASTVQSLLQTLTPHTPPKCVVTQAMSFADMLYTLLIEPTEAQYRTRVLDRADIFEAQKNGSAFDVLYTKYYKQISLYFFKHLSDHALAEDLTQETFLRAFSHLSTFVSSNATYYTYLLRIAHNMLVNQYRQKTSLSLEALDMPDIPSSYKTDTVFLQESIAQALSHLPASQQEMITLFYIQGYSVRDIAQRVGKSENAVKLHLSRARRVLQQVIDW